VDLAPGDREVAVLLEELVRHGAEARFAYTKALYDTYVAPEADVENPEPALA
jgi:hypothetical protein